MESEHTESSERPASLLVHADPQQLWFQINEIFDERTYLQHGVQVGAADVVFDVGANVGVAATFFASECGAARVYSFEPLEPIFALLKENTSRYRACVCQMTAIGSRSGNAEVTYYPNADAMSGLYADPERDIRLVDRVLRNRGVTATDRREQLSGRYEPQTLRCRIRTLSEVFEESGEKAIDLLKIDVERSEVDVLNGIGAGDWPRIRQVVAEVHEEAGRLEDVDGILSGVGFKTTWDQAASMNGTGVRVVYAVRGSQ